VVGYDSIIPPGREGSITQEVSVKNMHGGQISKSATVTSNAENNPVMQLTMRFKLIPLIGVVTNFISMTSTSSDSGRMADILTSQKKDLAIRKIRFKQEETPGQPFWEQGQSVDVKYTVKRAEKPTSEGFWEYTLSLAAKTNNDNPIRGDFIFETNHPKKPELKIKGILQYDKGPNQPAPSIPK
jgi:hypothetical protein